MMSLYRLTPLVYFLLPIVAVPWAIRAGRRGVVRSAPRSFAGICLAGGLLGIALSRVWTWLLGARVSMGQTAVTMYWMTATLCLLAAINLMLNRWLRRLGRACIARSTSNARRRLFSLIAGLLVAGKGILMTAAGVSVLAATLLSFRPKVVHEGTPTTILGATFETVDFRAIDGTPLRGWWIPSPGLETGARETVLLCHGFGADKASALPIARDLLASGFNVLAFDFRGYGESGGQLSTFGNIERRDVLGAVRWLKDRHPEQSRRILGLGVNMGAAALLGAASDPGTEGQAIDAIAAVDPFDDLGTWLGALAEERVAPLAGVFVARIALPLAGAQCGVDLYDWSPARDAANLWPRPLLVMHAGKDALVPLAAGQALFESAQQPKYHYWVENETPREMLYRDDLAARVVRVFFRRARAVI
jgi:fermentation-respiration switch protein FrsA (DUF1100 family)